MQSHAIYWHESQTTPVASFTSPAVRYCTSQGQITYLTRIWVAIYAAFLYLSSSGHTPEYGITYDQSLSAARVLWHLLTRLLGKDTRTASLRKTKITLPGFVES